MPCPPPRCDSPPPRPRRFSESAHPWSGRSGRGESCQVFAFLDDFARPSHEQIAGFVAEQRHLSRAAPMPRISRREAKPPERRAQAARGSASDSRLGPAKLAHHRVRLRISDLARDRIHARLSAERLPQWDGRERAFEVASPNAEHRWIEIVERRMKLLDGLQNKPPAMPQIRRSLERTVSAVIIEIRQRAGGVRARAVRRVADFRDQPDDKARIRRPRPEYEFPPPPRRPPPATGRASASGVASEGGHGEWWRSNAAT